MFGLFLWLNRKPKSVENAGKATLMSRAEGIIGLIMERGIPHPWQTFGMMLSKDGSLSTQIVAAIYEMRESKEETAQTRALHLFDEKMKNLQTARSFLKKVTCEYDRENTWEALTETLRDTDVAEILQLLEKDFALHPFPVILESLKFNWQYMRDHGVREFYVMTDGYLEKMEQVTATAKDAFEEEIQTKMVEPYWLIRTDLLSIETPTHCDVCRLTIAVVLAARELTRQPQREDKSLKKELVNA